MIRIASLAGVLAVGTGLALAAPANAATDTDEYIQWLDHNKVSYTSQQDAIDAGFALCTKLRDGQDYDSLLIDVPRFDAFPPVTVYWTTDVVDAASVALCPDTSEILNDGWADEDLRMFNPSLYAEWNRQDPDRFQKVLDYMCSNDSPEPVCLVVPERLANRLGDQNNQAARLTLSRLCTHDADTPPCV